ncbi:PH domain-containing protein [Kineosporia sp. R_H_3]|uniref:PH domain-containing protein n=1 Tax=Kineosporia sp. R_H_3 TaxID=1961848 RepID=UPI000B4BE83F|nr:PH domain-containing protein [Kineosporia sp. R_H_3]
MAVLPHKWPWRNWPVAELPREIPRYLADTETTILGGQVHEAVMIKPVAAFLGGTVLTFLGFANLPDTADGARNLLALAWVALLLWVSWRWFEWTRELTFISGYRMIKVDGVIIRKIRMMPIGKVTDMTYNKTPLGIILGYGTFIVESAGQDQAFSKLPFIPDPDNTYRHIQNLLFKKVPQDVNIVNISTPKRVNVGWTGRFRKDPDGRGGKIDQDDQNPW